MNKVAGTFLLLVGLSSCAYLSVNRDLPTMDMPQMKENAELNSANLQDWWKNFQDPVLNELIEYARVHNTDLQGASAKVDEARAVLGINKSEKLPRLDAKASATQLKSSDYVLTPGTPNRLTDYQVSLQASWELDLWGRIRKSTEAARSSLLAQQYNQNVVLLSLYSDVAQTYFNLLALDASLEITRSTISSRQESLQLQTKRLKGGIISEQDASQAEVELATAKANLPDLLQNIAKTESALNILIGASPRQIIEKILLRGPEINSLAVPTLPLFLPSDILLHRPDVQIAEQTLLTTRANIAVARAAYFPKISLTGIFGIESLDAKDLFTGPAQTWSLAGSLAMPLFNNGLTASQVQQAQAREQQAVASYRRAISQAFTDVKTSLSIQQLSDSKVQALKDQTQALQRLYKLANIRYNNGYENYLNLLDAQRSLYQAELLYISAKRDQLIASVTLYKALGGGWKKETEEK